MIIALGYYTRNTIETYSQHFADGEKSKLLAKKFSRKLDWCLLVNKRYDWMKL